MNTCSSCHWWFKLKTKPSEYGLCVLLTGVKGAPLAPLKYGGQKSLETRGDFGCNKWEEKTK